MKTVGMVLLVLVTAAVCFAQATADSVGIVGTQIVDTIGKLVGNNGAALSIYTAIVAIIGIALRVLLKKLPVVTQGIVGKIVWKLAAALFGSGVILENNKDTEYVKRELTKKYPVLQIDIKGPKGV